MPTLFYFPLESIKSRYTEQLCTQWMPDILEKVPGYKVHRVEGTSVGNEIKTGVVLDAVGRGVYSLTQCVEFLKLIDSGNVTDSDIVYLQDFWTPGLEAIFYALHLHNLHPRFYNMLHAQSVDEFDFTHPMLPWIRYFELGFDSMMSGTFVASGIHREQLKLAGWRSPIHVVGLPFGWDRVRKEFYKDTPKRNNIVYCSRLDEEKNPEFMMSVASLFLSTHPDWTWTVTTSAKESRSNKPGVIHQLKRLEDVSDGRFILRRGLSKADYYDELTSSKVLFNSSKQDYVSWTLLEANCMGCDVVVPDFRSFPECVSQEQRYRAFDVGDAIAVIERVASGKLKALSVYDEPDIAVILRAGEEYIVDVLDGMSQEYNVWEGDYK